MNASSTFSQFKQREKRLWSEGLMERYEAGRKERRGRSSIQEEKSPASLGCEQGWLVNGQQTQTQAVCVQYVSTEPSTVLPFAFRPLKPVLFCCCCTDDSTPVAWGCPLRCAVWCDYSAERPSLALVWPSRISQMASETSPQRITGLEIQKAGCFRPSHQSHAVRPAAISQIRIMFIPSTRGWSFETCNWRRSVCNCEARRGCSESRACLFDILLGAIHFSTAVEAKATYPACFV